MRTNDNGIAGPLSHGRGWRAGVVQSPSSPGMIDLGPGYLAPELLPVDRLSEAYATALTEFGSAALAYGDNQGALPFRELVAARTAKADGRPCSPAQTLLTAGTSQALHLIATTFGTPGATVFVDQVCYDLGRLILTDAGLRIVEIPGDSAGMDPACLATALRDNARTSAFVYVNPTFHNPTGLVVPLARRRELLSVAAAHDVLVVEDDAYAELGLTDTSTPISIAGLSAYERVIRLCTLSKTLAPGLRVGWMHADTATIGRLIKRGLLDSGGALNHTTSLAATVLIRDGGYESHLRWLRAQLAQRREALSGTLRERLSDDFEFAGPAGGFFIWLRCRGRRSELELVAAARAAGVHVSPGSRFGTTTQPCLRLAYSFHPPDRLVSAAKRLAVALNTASLRRSD
jgi:2-aminoadipate transaminase